MKKIELIREMKEFGASAENGVLVLPAVEVCGGERDIQERLSGNDHRGARTEGDATPEPQSERPEGHLGLLGRCGKGKDRRMWGELDGGVRVGADGRQSEALVVESGVGREERVKMVIHGEKGFFLL